MEPGRNMPSCGWSSVGRESRGLPAEEAGQNKIIVILGPTATGKSDVAIRLARLFNGEIISADSRQIYRKMDLGTGKVTKTEQQKAKHWMIDIVNPTNNYNVAKFQKQAKKIIDNILSRGKLPIICGGTGFWISAIVDNTAFPEVKPDRKLRKRLEKLGTDKLFKMLRKLDSKRAKNIDRNNKVRLIRAIEICKKIGKVPERNYESRSKNYEFLQIGINISKDKLYQNIKKRLKIRFQKGLIKEVGKLHNTGLGWKKIQSFGLAYYWIPLYLQNKISKKELFEKIYLAEKDYAKRQMTWFKRDSRIIWIKNYKKIEHRAKQFL